MEEKYDHLSMCVIDNSYSSSTHVYIYIYMYVSFASQNDEQEKFSSS
jgi:hypothetical protein